MPTNILIQVPNSLSAYHTFLLDFFNTMIYKLDKNSHKDTPTKENLQGIMDLLLGEIVEFEQQVHQDKFNENSLTELADQANFAFLAYVALRLEGVQHGRKNKESNPKSA